MAYLEQKKVWVKPELIILVRSKPEEAVLTACKTTLLAGINSSVNQCANFHRKNPGKTCDPGSCSTGGTS